MKPIAYYFDSPTVQIMSSKYGAYFEDLSESDRSCLMYLLVDAVNDLFYADMEEVSLLPDRFTWDDESVEPFIVRLDNDIAKPQDALNLIMGLAQSIERTLQDA